MTSVEKKVRSGTKKTNTKKGKEEMEVKTQGIAQGTEGTEMTAYEPSEATAEVNVHKEQPNVATVTAGAAEEVLGLPLVFEDNNVQKEMQEIVQEKKEFTHTGRCNFLCGRWRSNVTK